MITSAQNFNYYRDDTKWVCNLLNLWGIENNIVIGRDGSYSAVYKLTGIDYYLQTDNTLNRLAHINDLFLSLLPDDFIITFIYKIGDSDPAFIKNYRASANPPAKFEFIKEKKLEDLTSRLIKKVDIYLIATIKSFELEAALKTSIFSKVMDILSGLLKRSANAVENYNTGLEKLNNFTRNLSFLTSSVGIQARRLKNQELFDYLFRELNPSRTVDPPLIQNIDPKETLRSSLCYSPIYESKDCLTVGDKNYKFVNMHKLPAEIDTLGITELLNIANNYYFFKYTVAVSFYVPPQDEKYKQIREESNIKRSLSESTMGDYIDYKGKTEADVIEDLLQSVSKDRKKFIELSLSFRLEDDLKKDAETVIQACKHFNNMEAIDDNLLYKNIFLSFLPGMQPLNWRRKVTTSVEAGNFFPLHQGFSGTKNAPIALFNNRFEPVALDLLNNTLPAKHGLVFGKTRSGKGFNMNGWLSNYFLSADNIDIVGVDIGGTYEKFTRLFGGNYIEIELDGRYNLNPFPYKKDIIDRDGKYDADVLQFLSHVVMMMVLPNSIPEPNDHTIVLRAISAAYDKTREEDNPTFSDIGNILLNYKEPRDIADKQRAMLFGKNMSPWTDITSPYRALINQKGTIDLSNRINVFDLQKIKQHPELQKLAFAIIKNLTFKKMYDRQKRVLFFYDEIWELLNNPELMELTLHLYKASAKWDCAIYSITQEPKDLLKTPIGKSIISNSSVKMFLHLDVDVSSEDLAVCGLNEKEIQIVNNLRTEKGHFSEYFLKFGKDSTVIRNAPSPFEYWLYCKSNEDWQIENEINLKYPDKSLKERLEILADRYPHGPYGVEE